MYTLSPQTKAVIFDLDDTLYDFKHCHNRVMPLLENYAREKLGMEPALFRTEYKKMLEWQFDALPKQAGCHSRAMRFQLLLESHGLPLRHANVLAELYWNSMLDIMTPFPGCVALFQNLRNRGISIGIGTDMTADWQLKKLERLGLLDYVSFFVSSEETEEKPGSGMFLRCASKAAVPIDCCLFVGDNPKRDIKGAIDVGMPFLWIQPDPEKRALHPDYPSVASIAEIQFPS